MIDHRTALIDYLKHHRHMIVARMGRTHARIAAAAVARLPVDDLAAMAAADSRYIERLNQAITAIEEERRRHLSQLPTSARLPVLPSGQGDHQDGPGSSALPALLHQSTGKEGRR